MKMRQVITLFTFLVTAYSIGQVKNPLDDGRKIRIPVVFHVIYNNANENISDGSILNELKDLNLDFNARNDMALLDSDFRGIVGNPNIEFFLLSKTFEDKTTNGIQRIDKRNAPNLDDLLIDPVNCVNIFVGAHGNSFLTNKINLDYSDVGAHTHGLTHEIGHWLGLFHTFGQIGNSYFYNVWFGNHDDLIDDTPKQRRGSAVCYSITNDCPCPPKRRYYKKNKILYNNFMDYNPCRCMFTSGQVTRMRNIIIEDKPRLFQ